MELRRIDTDDVNLTKMNLENISVYSAYFGDPEFAMDVLEKLHNLNALAVNFLWIPIMHEVRKTPRFKEFIKEIGLVDYWIMVILSVTDTLADNYDLIL